MSTWDAVSTYYSGQGVVMIGTRDTLTGLPTGLVPVGNVSDLRIAVATSVLEHKESQSGQRSIDLRLTQETKASLTMTMESFNAANLNIALRASATDVTAGTVTDTTYTAGVQLGKVMALGHIKIDGLTLEVGTDTLVEYTVGDADGDWDYKVNEEAGSVMWAATPSTAIQDNDNVVVNYTYSAQKVIDALTQGATDYYLRFEGLNTAAENAPVVVEVFRFSVDPLKELALIGDGVQQFVMEGNVLADNLRTSGSKYFKQTLLA
jgi:hypothetical protein